MEIKRSSVLFSTHSILPSFWSFFLSEEFKQLFFLLQVTCIKKNHFPSLYRRCHDDAKWFLNSLRGKLDSRATTNKLLNYYWWYSRLLKICVFCAMARGDQITSCLLLMRRMRRNYSSLLVSPHPDCSLSSTCIINLFKNIFLIHFS